MSQDLNNQSINQILGELMGSISSPPTSTETINLPSTEGVHDNNLFPTIVRKLLRQSSITEQQLDLIKALLPYSNI